MLDYFLFQIVFFQFSNFQIFECVMEFFESSNFRMNNCAESKILFLQREVDFNSPKLNLESVVLHHHPICYTITVSIFGAGFAYA